VRSRRGGRSPTGAIGAIVTVYARFFGELWEEAGTTPSATTSVTSS
jgi:hypothetical protein